MLGRLNLKDTMYAICLTMYKVKLLEGLQERVRACKLSMRMGVTARGARCGPKASPTQLSMSMGTGIRMGLRRGVGYEDGHEHEQGYAGGAKGELGGWHGASGEKGGMGGWGGEKG